VSPTARVSRNSQSQPDDHPVPSTPAFDDTEPEPGEQPRTISLFEANDIPGFFARDSQPDSQSGSQSGSQSEDDAAGEREPEPGPDEFTVRPAHGLHGFLAGGSALLAVGFAIAAYRGFGYGLLWRLVLAAGFAALAGMAIRALVSKPLLVADRTGIRLRIRREWIGAPWEEIEAVTVLPRRHMLDDGRIAIHLSDPGPVVAAIARDANRGTRKMTDRNRRLTGSSLAVPFGLAATPSEPLVVSALAALADERCPVTEQP
jgi:hypothetical protein